MIPKGLPYFAVGALLGIFLTGALASREKDNSPVNQGSKVIREKMVVMENGDSKFLLIAEDNTHIDVSLGTWLEVNEGTPYHDNYWEDK